MNQLQIDKTKSGFYIVNTADRPDPERLAEAREDGFYYVHPILRDFQLYHGMRPVRPTPVEHFGIRIELREGRVYGYKDTSLPVTATYEDDRPRQWQGPEQFDFPL